MVKRFLQLRGAKPTRTNKYAKSEEAETAPFDIVTRKAIAPTADEMATNTRARSAKLRIARRTAVQAPAIDARETGMPTLPPQRRSKR